MIVRLPCDWKMIPSPYIKEALFIVLEEPFEKEK